MILKHFHSCSRYKKLVLLCILLCTQLFFGQKDHLTGLSPQAIFTTFTAYKYENRIDKALETLNEIAKTAEVKQDTRLLLDVYHHYVELFLEEGDQESAAFYWERAKVLLRGLPYNYGRIFNLYLEAALRYAEGDYLQALKIAERVKILNRTKTILPHIRLLEARLYTQLERYEEAVQNLQPLVSNTSPAENAYRAAEAYLQWATLNRNQNQWKDAIAHTKAALTLARENHFYALLKTTHRQLSLLYEKQGGYRQALQYQKSLAALKDSVFTLEKAALTAKTANQIRLKHQQNEIERLTATNKALSEAQNRSQLTAILASALLTLISLLAISLYRNNQIKLKTNALLHTKNKELKLARDAAVAAMNVKNNFLSTISHELRTPLYAVTGLTHLLLQENPSEHQKEYLKSLQFSGEHLLNLINDILQINKIEAHKPELLNIPFDLQKVLTDIVDSLQQKARDTNTTLLLAYDSNIPSHLLGDPVKLSQIFINLASNAIKFTKNGEVILKTQLLEEKATQITVSCEIKDNGIGISEEQQQHIFERFQQGSLEINREYGGTGLGLAIVKNLLHLFGSTITLESEPGRGSTFSFTITLNRNTAIEEKGGATLPPEAFDYKGLHLLLVEDNKVNQLITKKMLAQKEMSCDLAIHGEKAVALAQTQHYDAILMDLHLPGISGEEATRQIRELNPRVPVIALTAAALDDNVERFYEAGGDAIVTKPFKPEVFYQTIADAILNKNSEGEEST